jgi:hypothetical protein
VWVLGPAGPRALAAEGTVRLPAGALCFVNPGAVDSARQPSPGRAACALFDSAAMSVEFARVPYDHAAAESKARRQGYRQPRWALKIRRALGV